MEVITPSKDPSIDQEYLTISEFARLVRRSPLTVRRHIANPKSQISRDIEWVDFFSNGKLVATRESVERFRENCHRKMKKSLEGVRRAKRHAGA